MDHDLAGRVALVTGGSRGIGAAVARALAGAGADVAITYLNSQQAAENVGDHRCLAPRVDATGTASQPGGPR